MKKGFLKRLATENLVEKLLSLKKDEHQPSCIRLLASVLYLFDICIFYIVTPCILGGFTYIYYQRENYLISICSFVLFLCACIFTYQKCRKYMISAS